MLKVLKNRVFKHDYALKIIVDSFLIKVVLMSSCGFRKSKEHSLGERQLYIAIVDKVTTSGHLS